MVKQKTDFDVLAKRYLDLWQDQVNALAADPATADAVAKGIGALSGGIAAMMNGGAQSYTPPRETPPHEASTQTRPSSTVAASVDPGDFVNELLGRLAQLEKRVAELEKLQFSQSISVQSAQPKSRRRPVKAVPQPR